ncbi:hypothetical protein [Psychrobacillus sp. NPDC096623]|uniref:hypothetical protein n=1 Tax=Psychrobacillus sp. NPDC096623 TaxID=3364492 RepID=UPI003826EE8F
MNLKHFLSGVSVAFAVILFRLIDEYLIDIPTLIGALMVALFAAVVIKVIQSIPTLDRKLKKPTYLTLWIMAFVCILGSFHFFDL